MPLRKVPLKWSILLLAFISTACVACVLWFVPAIPEVNSGDPVPREGTVTNPTIVPNLDDREYYELALDIVGKNGWSANDISLSTIGRTLSCGSSKDDLKIWLALFRWRRVGLRWTADIGNVNISPYRHEATYYLSESQGSVSDSLFHDEGVDLSEFKLDSGDAVSLADKNVHGSLPTTWGDECEIGVINVKDSTQPTWEISYISNTSDVVIRMRVDGISGEISWVEKPPS